MFPTLREAPFVRLLVPLIAGILLGLWLRDAWIAKWLCVGMLLLWGASMVVKWPYKFRWVTGALLTLTVFCGGLALPELHLETNDETFVAKHVTLGDATKIKVRILEPVLQGEKTYKTKAEALAIQDSTGQWNAVSGRMLLYIQISAAADAIAYGDELLLNGARLREPSASTNPCGFDYRQYLYYKNIHLQAYVADHQWRKIAVGKGNRLMSMIFQWQAYCVEVMHKYVGSGDEFAIASALVFGYRSDISDEANDAYADTGATHVLSVSGLHISMVALMLQWLLSWLNRFGKSGKWVQTAILLGALWTFALLTGASAAVLRATLMFSLLIVGKAMSHKSNIFNTLAASAFLLYCYDPFLVVDVGLLLSYSALIGILLFQPWLYGQLANNIFILDRAWNLTSVALAAQLGTFPIGLLFFHQFPTYFWLSGFVVVPVSFVVLPLGIALVAFSWWPAVATFLGAVLFWLVWLMNSAMYAMQALPASTIDGFWLWPWEALLWYAVIGAGALFIATRKFRPLAISLSILGLLGASETWKSYQHSQQRQFTVYSSRDALTIGYIQGFSATLFTDTSALGSHDIGRLVNAHHAFMRIRSSDLRHWPEGVRDSVFQIQWPLAQIGDSIRIQKQIYKQPMGQWATHVLIDKGSSYKPPKLDIYDKPKTILILPTASYKAAKAWTSAAQKVGWPIWNMKEQGAFVQDL